MFNICVLLRPNLSHRAESNDFTTKKTAAARHLFPAGEKTFVAWLAKSQSDGVGYGERSVEASVTTPTPPRRMSGSHLRMGRCARAHFFGAPGIVRRWVESIPCRASRRGDGYDPAEDRGVNSLRGRIQKSSRVRRIGTPLPGSYP